MSWKDGSNKCVSQHARVTVDDNLLFRCLGDELHIEFVLGVIVFFFAFKFANASRFPTAVQ